MACPVGYHYVKPSDRENYNHRGKNIHFTDTTYGTYFKKDRKELKAESARVKSYCAINEVITVEERKAMAENK